MTSASLTRASWLFVAIAAVLIAVLAYYLTLTTRPEITEIRPVPNSSQVPGPVELAAVITSQRDIDEVRFFIDGQPVSPAVDHNGDQQWTVSYEQVFERGEREIVLQITDDSGRVTEHTWTFEAGGELVPPRLALMAPPTDAVLAADLGGLTIHATTFAEIDNARLTLNGDPLDVRIEPLDDPASEYTSANGLPVFEWEISAATEFPAGRIHFEAIITDEYGASTSTDWTFEASEAEDEVTALFFPETRTYTVEPFLSFWEEHDGIDNFGPAVGPLIRTENGREEQYFRYTRLERDEEGVVHLGLIGREIFGDPESPPDRPPGDGSRLFDPTGHYIYGVIREYWEENGGLTLFGYPLSQEFSTEDGYAQYFERALIRVIEQDGETEVERAPLGEQLYRELQQSDTRPGADADGSDEDEEESD